MSTSTLSSRLQGQGAQFHVELLYGILFVAGFGYLVFRVDPRVAAFEGGLVVGYLLRVWEKMSIYERILEEAVSREAETQVEAEVERRVGDEVADEVEQQVGEEVADELEEQVGDELERQIDAEVDDRLGEQLPEGIEEADDLEGLLEDLDDAPEVEELVVEGDVEELVAEEVDAALEGDGRESG